MMTTGSDPFHWARKVSRKDIQRLYASDAQGMLDEDLLEKVSFAIYTRIQDMLEVREAQTFGRVHCRSCGALLAEPFRMGTRNKGRLLICAQCGWQVTCGDYYDSYTGERMLPGSVPEVFLAFMQRWPQANTPQQKMLLIDWLIHEFHVNQGIEGRPVGENVIQGSKQQVSELIAGLATGSASTPGLSDPQVWQARFDHPIRQFRQAHSYQQILKIAAELGIQGRSQMAVDVLVNEIYRLAPHLFPVSIIEQRDNEG